MKPEKRKSGNGPSKNGYGQSKNGNGPNRNGNRPNRNGNELNLLNASKTKSAKKPSKKLEELKFSLNDSASWV